MSRRRTLEPLGEIPTANPPKPAARGPAAETPRVPTSQTGGLAGHVTRCPQQHRKRERPDGLLAGPLAPVTVLAR